MNGFDQTTSLLLSSGASGGGASFRFSGEVQHLGIQFRDCDFVKNYLRGNGKEVLVSGGGVEIVFEQEVTHCLIAFNSGSFRDNSLFAQGEGVFSLGGGLGIRLLKGGTTLAMRLSSVLFADNSHLTVGDVDPDNLSRVPFSQGGGWYFRAKGEIKNSAMWLRDCDFSSNTLTTTGKSTAVHGGGVYIRLNGATEN